MATIAARAHPAAAPAADAAPTIEGRLASCRLLLRFGCAMAVALAAASLPASALFTVREVVVAGARTVQAAAIIDRAAIRPGQRRGAVDPERAARRIAALPRVAEAAVTVGLDGRVTLVVRERMPQAAVPHRGRYLILDRSAIVMDVASHPGRLPVVSAEGFAPPWVRAGSRLPDRRIDLALRALEELPEGVRAPGMRLRVTADEEVVLVTPDGIPVRLGAARGLAQRAALLPELLDALRVRRLAVEYLDLRYAGSVVMKPLAADRAGERP
jgi:cell division septal protein FtsQ